MPRIIFDLMFLCGLGLFDYSFAQMAGLSLGLALAGIELAFLGFLGGVNASRSRR